jgi:hypothetical protein
MPMSTIITAGYTRGTHTNKFLEPATSWLRRPAPPAAMVQGLICVHVLADLRN